MQGALYDRPRVFTIHARILRYVSAPNWQTFLDTRGGRFPVEYPII